MSYQNAFRKAYHGTSKEALASILKQGLIPGASAGADAWADAQHRHFPGRGAVFLSTLPTIAALFSQFAAQVHTHRIGKALVEGGVVLEIDLQDADPSMIAEDDRFDADGDNSEALIYHGPIPAKWIRSYCAVTPTAEQMPEYLSMDYIHAPALALEPSVAVAA